VRKKQSNHAATLPALKKIEEAISIQKETR
jgi:hypothetical protein